MKSDTTTNENCLSVTNTSGEKLVVLSSYNESSEANSYGPFENTLAMFKTTKDQAFISDQETALIRLDGVTTLKGEKIPSLIYDLLFVRATSFFPIANHAVSTMDDDFEEEPSSKSLTITEEDKEKMVLARKFCMLTFASPHSKLAKGFQKALGSSVPAKGLKDLQDVETAFNFDAVDKFLKGTKLYKTLDFSAVHTEMSYLRSYVGPWVHNKKTSTFYLYNNDQSKDLSNPTLVGTLHLTRLTFSTSTFELKKGYKIIFTDAKTKQEVPLKFENQVFVSDKQGVSISLNPYFMKKSKLTKKSTDKDIIVCIAGEVEKQKVLGSETELDLKKSPYDPGSFYTFIHPTTFMGTFNLAMSIVGVLFAVQFLGGIMMSGYRFVKRRLGMNDPNPIESLNEKIDKMSHQFNEQFEKKGMKRVDPREIDKVGDELAAEEIRLNESESLVSSLKSCRAINTTLKATVKIEGPSRNIENMAKELREVHLSLRDSLQKRIGSVESLNKGLLQQVKSLQNQVLSLQNKIRNELRGQDLIQARDAERNLEEFDEVQEELEKNAKEVGEGESTAEREAEVGEVEGFETGELLIDFMAAERKDSSS